MRSIRTLIFCLIGLSPTLQAQEEAYDCSAQSAYIVKTLHSTGVSGKSTLKSTFLSDELDKISKVIDLFEHAESDLLEKDWYKLNDSYNNLHLALKYTFDSDLKTLVDSLNRKLSWNPLKDSILISDFDDNTYFTDIIGYLSNKTHLGTGISEGTIASGDSGGAAFIDNKIAGWLIGNISKPPQEPNLINLSEILFFPLLNNLHNNWIS